MKVLLDTRPAADQGTVGRYSRCLLRALRDTAAASDEVLDTNRPSATVRANRADLFHSPWIDGAMLHSPCPMVVTLHDLRAHKRRSEHLRGGLRMRLRPLAVQRAARVIVPTAAVAQDAVTHLQLARERVSVIPEAPDASMYRRSEADVEAARRRFGLPERYLVWVGSLQHPDPASHLAQLAAAPRELPLVLVGATRPWAHELEDVILTGPVGDEQLGAIYSGAHALVVSSEQDGFGLPAIEALACGTPVVATEGPGPREILGERATFVPAGDMPALLATAQRAGRPAPPPPSWSWEDAARATWAVYAEALVERTRSATQPLRRRSSRGRPAAG